MKKTVAFCIPCYNEQENVVPMVEQLVEIMENTFSGYDYNIQFIDNCSTDTTREKIRNLCAAYPQVRAIFNAKNFPLTSGYHGILAAQGDCVISIPADFQVPLEKVPEMIAAWEKGYKIVCLQKDSTQSGKGMWHVRQFYYHLADKFSEGKILKNFTGSGLYDKSFLDVCRATNIAVPNFMQMIQTHGSHITSVFYQEQKRKAGKSKNNFFTLLDIALLRFTNTSAIAPKLAVYTGFLLSIVSALIGLIYLILKLIFWDRFVAGMAPVLIGVFFMGAIQLFFIGLIGQYIIRIDKRTAAAPLVVEEERLNFRAEEEQEKS